MYFDALSTDWIDHLRGQRHDMQPLLNDETAVIDTVKKFKPHLIIFTGGEDLIGSPKNAAEKVLYRRDRTEKKLLSWAIKKDIPCLGVCRGAQMLNIYFGGKLTPSNEKMHVVNHHPVIFSDTLNMFSKKISVNSFHKWGIKEKNIGKHLVPFATDLDGMIEAYHHDKLPIMGLMWHPERTFDNSTSDKLHNKKFYESLMKNFFLKR